jgi:hypothetical protein
MSLLNVTKLANDYNIPIFTSGKNVSSGWVNFRCPYPKCSDTSNHLGYNLAKDYFRCWKCGWHGQIETLCLLLRLDKPTVISLIYQYGGQINYRKVEKEIVVKTKAFQFPSNAESLSKSHKRYLKDRKFDPNYLSKTWGILGTGPVSHLDGIKFNRRIIVPITWDGKVVSFTARDITNRHPLRYIACPKPREIVHHKNILYGRQQDWSKDVIVVEGVTDVFRLGTRAVATFGIEYTRPQIRIMAKNFRRVFVLYDDEPQAQDKAAKLVAELKFYGIFAKQITIVGDPGGMDQSEADVLIKELLG